MPPQRTIPPAKAIKTERTHEENQERAYIAASRRSDRSLEARVESARRASEIHKRRTGRSLRVTEQDVINEEMYEEEDDDMPLNYRRLTAHLQTGSADFNRRLSAYLTNHVAIRSAVEQAVQNSYAQQYPNAPQFARNPTMYQSPMMPFQGQQMMMHQNMPPRPGPAPSYHPYAMQQQPSGHGRSASIAGPQDLKHESIERASPATTSDSHRRASMPSTPMKMESPQQSHSHTQTPQPGAHFQHGNLNQASNQQAMPGYFPHLNMSNFGKDMMPFSTALPPESQMLLGSALDPNDPLTAMLMTGSENLVMPNYGFNQTNSNIPLNKLNEGHQKFPYFEGLNSTLADGIAPSVLEMHDNQNNQAEFQFNPSAFPMQMRQNSGPGSAVGTPGLSGDKWDQWIDSEEWGDMPTASQ